MRRQQRLFIICLLILPLFVSANYVHWQGDYNKALEQSHKEHKPLLVLIVKKDTTLCNEIIEKTFMNQPYIDRINSEMVAVIVTYEGVLSYPIEMYYTTIFPTLFFVDSKRELFLAEPLYGERIDVTGIKKNLDKLLIF